MNQSERLSWWDCVLLMKKMVLQKMNVVNDAQEYIQDKIRCQ